MLHAPRVFGVMASAMSSKSSDANFLFTFFSKSSNYLKTTRLKKRQVCNLRTILPSIACDQAFYFILFCLIVEGEQEWRSECARLSQLWPNSIRFRSGAISGLRLLLVPTLLRGFFPGTPNFLPPTSSNSPRLKDPRENQLRLMWLPLIIL